ncbi:MAG: DUF4349 domain-containing protein, partial [Planctomycetes bacterium]|nr:DUF4349 domain-containing protein [Planctomycetota bacterium]
KLDKYDKSPEFKGKNKPNAEGPPASKMPPIGPIGLPMPPGYGLGGGGPIFAPPGTPPGGIIPAMTTPPPPAPPVPVLPSYFDENKKDSGKPTGQPGKGKYDEAEGKQGGDPKQGDAKKGDPDGKEKGQSKDPEGDNKPGDKAPKGSETPKSDPKPKVEEPIDAGRKIIRTGEMEFEVEKFDDARNIIIAILKGDKKDGKVIYAGVPGGFVATSNSDQLPNGKMRGSIVVRMPPQHLDEFIRDLRRALTVKGELKNERITSLDVTKQYTDMESRLRAARTMEERLIQIIKIGKGEIKDLVAAERELGVWRTKIEEMEGEIRYYSNQVSLSTLTITLTEKEIFAPASVVLTENVKLRVEVDNVAEAHQAAMAAVEEFKGTLTKSDLKLHPGGQLQSIIQAEIPPANKKDFTKKIEKLGIPSDYQEFQYQHTEGGTGKALSLKQRKGDVRFDLTMFNNANIRPRLASDLKIATADVPGDYAKILESVAKVRGQVRDAKLNEQDKLNINAYVDFNVPTSEKPAIDKLLFDIGPILERVNIRAPFSELSTERKFGYTVMLRDFAAIPPTKSAVETIATTDVPAAYAKLQEAIAKVKGLITDARVNDQDKMNVNAQIDFSIPSEEFAAFEKILKDLGMSLSRTNVQAPMKQLSTGRKFGYSIALRDFASIPPSKAVFEVIATADVPDAYARLQEAITKVKGLVADARVNEQDKMNVNAQLDFTIPSEEVAAIEKILKDLGTALVRTSMQAPMKQLSTARRFGYSIALRDFASVPPSKMVIERIAVKDVPTTYLKVLDAINKAKAVVVDSKLNEQDKTNVNAQLDFTVMIEEKPTIDALVTGLGISLTRTNVQTPVNVMSTTKKFGYMLDLRDLATVPPTKYTDQKIATNDVPANYAKLLDAVAKIDGHVANAKLYEEDKLNIKAEIGFSVPTDKKGGIDKLLDDIGPLLSRNNAETPANQLRTDKKFGYSIELHDFASIRPSHFSKVTIAASKVPANYAMLLEAIAKVKGQIHAANLNEQDKLNITGVIDFSVPSTEKKAIEDLLGEVGTVLSRTNDQTPANVRSTDRKYGFAVTMSDFANIPARETFILQIAMNDVPATFRELQATVGKAKGWISVGQLREDNKAKIEAQLNFDVPVSEKAAIET